MVAIGDVVTFVDSLGMHHNALVTNVWGAQSKEERDVLDRQWLADHRPDLVGMQVDEYLNRPFVEPSINCVLVVSDETQTDSYGRQIERRTSVPARSAQPAPGMYWFKQD